MTVKTSTRLFIPMTKYDAEKGIAYGVAASSTLDRSNEIFDYETSKPLFEKWSQAAVKATAGKSMGNLRAMHGNTAAGKLEQITFNDDDELIEIAAKVVDANEQKKCEEGVYTGFSMGGKYVKKWKDGDAMRYTADPYEISLVDLPCIPDATFEYVKAAGVTELRKFHVEIPAEAATTEPTNDQIATKATELATAAGRTNDWIDFVADARKALVAAVVAPADLEPKHVLAIATAAVDDDVTKGAADGGDEDWAQVWTHPRLPGETFAKKADLRAALTAKDAEASATKLAAPVTEALKSLTSILDDKDPAGVQKNTSDNPDFAGKDEKDDPKAKDGKKPDPKAKAAADAKAKAKAKDEADKSKPMKSAIDVIGRAKALMAASVPSFVERREIIKAATDLNALAVLPDGFIDAPAPLEKSASPELRKSATLYSVSNLIGIVASLENFHSQVCGTSPQYGYYGSDGVTQIEVSDATRTKVSDLCDQLGAAAAEMLDEILAEMKEEEAEKAVGRGTVLGDLRKIGARNSTSDKNRLRKAHDLLAEIEPAMCGHDTSKSTDDGDLSKRLEAQESAFTKTLVGIGDIIKDVAERVKRIEAQPIPGRPSHVNVVEKNAQFEPLFNPDAVDTNAAAFIEMSSERNRLGMPRR